VEENVPMYQCANVQMCQYANVPICQCANVPICQCANVPMCKFGVGVGVGVKVLVLRALVSFLSAHCCWSPVGWQPGLPYMPLA